MSFVDVREAVRDSPLRARSLFTVRAAISSARDSDAPWDFWLSLMCSYWRARLVPFLTPRGGMAQLLSGSPLGYPVAGESLHPGRLARVMTARRSCLSVPGSSEKMLAKA